MKMYGFVECEVALGGIGIAIGIATVTAVSLTIWSKKNRKVEDAKIKQEMSQMNKRVSKTTNSSNEISY